MQKEMSDLLRCFITLFSFSMEINSFGNAYEKKSMKKEEKMKNIKKEKKNHQIPLFFQLSRKISLFLQSFSNLISNEPQEVDLFRKRKKQKKDASSLKE